MLESFPFGDDVICIKTASEQDGHAFFWVYSFLIDDVMLDAGCANAREEMQAFAEKKKIRQVYVSHAHEDHYGCCSALEALGAEIYAVPNDMELLRNPPEYGELFRVVWGQPDPTLNPRIMPDAFQAGDLTFETIPLPGHWPSMIGFLEPERRWFFSADAVPLPSRKKIGMPEENVPLMIDTMEKIKNLEIEVLFDSHRGPITDVVPHIQARIDHLTSMQEQSRALHKEGKTILEIQHALGIEAPWYIQMAGDRFGIDILIKSLIYDTPEGKRE